MKAIVRIGDLRAAVDRAMLAVERRSTIPILSCLHLSQSSKGLTVMGTDLDMVVTATSPVLSAMGAPVCVNGHRRVEFHGDAKGVLRMSFVLDGVRLDTKLIDGTFPDYRRVFPPSIAVEMDASPGRLLQVLQRLSPFWQGSDHRTGRLHVPVSGPASIACGSKDDGAILAAPIRRASGQGEVLTGFNSAYFRACLQAAGGTTVRMRYADHGSPLHFVAEDGGEFLCMPLRFVETTLFTTLPEGAGLAEAA